MPTIRLECEYCAITAHLGGGGPDAHGDLPPIRVDCPNCACPLGLIAVDWASDEETSDWVLRRREEE